MGGNSDMVVLSFGDSLIRESDIALLSGPHWLNDRIISFYFEYLHQKKFDSGDRVCFISPEVSQFHKLATNAEISIFLEPLALENKDVIVLAVNNAANPDQPGGSHWSLLIYSAQSEEFYHFDSSSGMNSGDARPIAARLHSFLQKKKSDLSGMKVASRLAITEVSVLQQSNGYDCGIHTIANADNATRHFLVYGSPEGLNQLAVDNVKKMRKDVKSLILQMAGIDDR